MRSLAVAVLVSPLLVATARGQDVTYEKFQLDNGLTVILHEDHTTPVCAVNLWYRVGSKDEPVRRSGFAHLFEHLMFMGTRRVPTGQFDAIMSAGGGSNNATTSEDRTNYFAHGPAELLPTLLWLDADRLEDLGANMTQEKLDKQRDIVRNERRQSHENRPYGKAELEIEGLMFPEGHPYHIPVIGTHEDLEAAQVQDVKDFFATHYVPNNCALAIAGDFDAAKTKELVKKLFGTIKKGGAAPHRTASPVKLAGVIRATSVDKVQLPRLSFAYHSPATFAEGDAEMDLAATVLAGGKTSRLYKRLVMAEKVANNVRANQDSMQLGGVFRIDVTPRPGVDLDKVEALVDEELAKFLEAGPTKDELDRRKAELELSALTRLQSPERIADKLNEYEYFFGEPNSFKRDLDRYRNATPEGVRDRARAVLTKDARLIYRVLPEAPRHQKSARDERPAPFEKKAFEPAAPEKGQLSNGVSLVVFNRPALPLVAASLVFDHGTPFTDAEGKKAGLAGLTAQMLREGAGERDALAFEEAMQSLGARFSTNGGMEQASASLTVLKRSFDAAAALAADALRRPRLDAKDWDRVKRLHLDGLKRRDDSPTTVAGTVAQRLLFGDKNPFAWPSEGTAESIGALTLDDVKAAYGELFRPDRLTVFVAGDITLNEAKTTFEKLLGDWKPTGGAPAAASDLAPPAHEGLRFAIVDRPDAVQTVIRLELPGPRYADPNRVSLRLLNGVLGGGFSSRINQNLREAHGYTYGASSRFGMGRDVGTWIASTSVRADVTGASLKELLAEIEKIRKGDVTDAETTRVRETLHAESVHATGDISGLIGIASEYAANGLGFDQWAKDLAKADAAKTADLNGLAKDAIPLEKGVLVLVGDKERILEQLKGLPLPEPVEYDAHGEKK